MKNLLCFFAFLFCTSQLHAGTNTNYLRFLLYTADQRPLRTSEWKEIFTILSNKTDPADISIQSGDKLTLLHHAAREDIFTLIVHLIARGADKNAMDRWGYTPLMHAALKGNYNAISALLDLGADANLTGSPDGNPLSLASDAGHRDIAKILRMHGAKKYDVDF